VKYSAVSEVQPSLSNDAPQKAPSPAVTATKRAHASDEKPKDYDMNDILNQIIEEAKKVADLVRFAPPRVSFSINKVRKSSLWTMMKMSWCLY